MILDKKVIVTISNQGSYFKKLGYEPSKCIQRSLLEVSLKDLQLNSNKKVSCKCDDCGLIFKRQYQLLMKSKKHRCFVCARKEINRTNILFHGLDKRMKCIGEKQKGINHPRWNPNKPELKKFTGRVHWLSEKTYRKHNKELNPENKKRTLCGIENGFQLDHIVSIEKAFKLGWSPERCSEVTNLQMLPWKENRSKWNKEILKEIN